MSFQSTKAQSRSAEMSSTLGDMLFSASVQDTILAKHPGMTRDQLPGLVQEAMLVDNPDMTRDSAVRLIAARWADTTAIQRMPFWQAVSAVRDFHGVSESFVEIPHGRIYRKPWEANIEGMSAYHGRRAFAEEGYTVTGCFSTNNIQCEPKRPDDDSQVPF